MPLTKIKVLFVCLGNICRSTMAEGVFRDLIDKKGLAALVECDSAGTANYHVGAKADRRTLQVLTAKGISLSHRGRQLSVQDFHYFDYILAMDKHNYLDIQTVVKGVASPKAKVLMMRQFDAQQSSSDVPDPYYGELIDFEEVYEIVKEASEGLVLHLNLTSK
ncbi:MAG: hypothetical protein RL060_2179 [Bacteroidota bacterium]|jgi:protein-tyrosine phosphatase